jgi:hypothetical protein
MMTHWTTELKELIVCLQVGVEVAKTILDREARA